MRRGPLKWVCAGMQEKGGNAGRKMFLFVMRSRLALSTILPSIRRTAFLQCVSALLGIEEGPSWHRRRPFFGLKKAVLRNDPLFFSHLYKTVSKLRNKLRRMSQNLGIFLLSDQMDFLKVKQKCKYISDLIHEPCRTGVLFPCKWTRGRVTRRVEWLEPMCPGSKSNLLLFISHHFGGG